MNAQTNGNGTKRIDLQSITSLLAGNPMPLIKKYITRKSPRDPEASTRGPVVQVQRGSNSLRGDAAMEIRKIPSPANTIESALNAGYDYAKLSRRIEITASDEERVRAMGQALAGISMLRPFDPDVNSADRELAAALQKNKDAVESLSARLPHVELKLIGAQVDAANTGGPEGERPSPPQIYIAAASLLIALLPFLTVRDLMVTVAYDDPIFTIAVAAAAALVIGFVSTQGLFHAPPLKVGEGHGKAWRLAAGLSLSLFVVRLSITSSLLISVGFSAFEFFGICLVERFASRHRLSAYEWDSAHEEKRKKLELVKVASDRVDSVREQIRNCDAEIDRRAYEISLRELQTLSPQDWATKVVDAYLFGHAKGVNENRARHIDELNKIAQS